MKTLQNIKEDVAKTIGYKSWEDYRNNNIISERTLERVSKLYAEQALDLAAETVEIKYVPYDSKLYDHPDWDLDNDGRFYQIDKDSILSLKDQLK